MPHFYRYTGDDEEYQPKSVDSQDQSSPSHLDEVNISCLGVETTISVPAQNQQNKTNINILFYELDKTIQALKQENVKLREEVAALRQSQETPREESTSKEVEERLDKLENSLNDPVQNKVEDDVIEKLTTGVEEIKIKVNELENQQKDYESKTQTIIEEFITKPSQGQNMEDQNLLSVDEIVEISTDSVKEQIDGNAEEPSMDSIRENIDENEDKASEKPTEDILNIVQTLQEDLSKDLADLKASMTMPLSVMFDANRYEDWKGIDDFLPFDKANINLGGGFNIETGKFTAPVGGLYFFTLNVYGAPRDAIILSIRANEFQDIANICGVGKGSQSVLIHLDANDTCGVWVDEKTKMTDSGTNHFTHFIGLLIRPKELYSYKEIGL